MSDFNLISKSLSSNYVYYTRLRENEDPEMKKLYDNVVAQMHNAKAEAERVKIDTSFIRAQADQEREKELNLIARMTGFRPSPGDWGPNAQNIIDAINSCMNLKEVYERNYQTIVAQGKTHGKGVYSFFGSYLQTALNREWPNFVSKIGLSGIFNIQEQDILNWLRNDILPMAIENMLKAEVEDGVDPSLQNAYQEVLQAMGSFSQQGSFAQQLATIYDLDAIASEIMNNLSISGPHKASSVSDLSNAKLEFARGGLTLEALYDTILGLILPDDGVSGKANVGSMQAKADNIATIGIDISKIENFLNNQQTGTRIGNVQAFMGLSEHLQGLSESFIIYTSDKNYSITDGFQSRGGFSAGTALSLWQYKNLMAMAGKNVSAFVGAIEQLAKGAVGENMKKKDYADLISKNIAFLLFDDYNTIGAGLENGPQAIHLMNLNGVLIPISSILYALVDALENTGQLTGLVRTSIKLPDIMFPTTKSQTDYEIQTGGSAWQAQKQDMLDKSRIETHFLGKLRDLLKYQTFR